MGPQGGTVIPLGQINQTAARPGAGGGVVTVRATGTRSSVNATAVAAESYLRV
jgi:hypothetical protein